MPFGFRERKNSRQSSVSSFVRAAVCAWDFVSRCGSREVPFVNGTPRAASRADRISVASLSFTQKLKNSRSKTFAFSARSGAQQPRQAHETSSAPARFWVVRTTRVRVRARGVAIPDVWRTRRQPRSRGVCQKRVAWVWSAKNFRRPAPGGTHQAVARVSISALRRLDVGARGGVLPPPAHRSVSGKRARAGRARCPRS